MPGVTAFVFDGAGGARAVSLDELPASWEGEPPGAFSWVHLHRGRPEAGDWLTGCDLDAFVIDALKAEETRPRCTVHGDGALVVLRGVNLSPGAEPEDMVSVRLWIEKRRVVGVWVRPLLAVLDLIDAIGRGRAPVSPGDLVAKLALRLADQAEPTVAALNERVDELEQMELDGIAGAMRGQLADIRRTSIMLRRFMVPQRDALTTFEIEDLDWLSDRDRSRIREAAERVTRLGEELDAIRDRAQVVHDHIMDERAETMNKRMLVLSIVAAMFLPLGLVTGLLGINVGGIPGTDDPWAFYIVCALLVVLGAAQLWLIRRLGMMR